MARAGPRMSNFTRPSAERLGQRFRRDRGLRVQRSVRALPLVQEMGPIYLDRHGSIIGLFAIRQ